VKARALAALPLLVATALFVFVTHAALFAVVVVVGLAVALPLAQRLAPPPWVQRALLLVVGLVAALWGAKALVGTPVPHSPAPSVVWGVVAATALLVALTRRFFSDPEWGTRPELGLVAAALVACGQRRVGLVYVVAVVLALAAIVISARARDARFGWSVVEGAAPRALIGLLLAVGGLSAAGMLALPRVERFTTRQFERFVLPSGAAQVGFGDRLGAASLDGLLGSDALVARVYGPRVDYLRGRVYDTYDRGGWESVGSGPPVRVPAATGRPDGPRVTEIRAVGALGHADPAARFFAPLGAGRLGTSRGELLADAFGALRPLPDDQATPLFFEVGAPGPGVAPPTDTDLVVPGRLRAALEPLALEWTRGATTPAARLAAIDDHLRRDFTYSLDATPATATRDPSIVTFLLRTRRGHCELFASALAILGRIAGVPARVVGGFRVAEHNAVGDYDVVRERNAHAWVEAWVGGDRWTTFDPTPPTEANLRRDRRALDAVGDALLALLDRMTGVSWGVRPWHGAVLLAVAVVALVTLRWWRARRARRSQAAPIDPGAGPLPCFSRLLAALARRGYPRPDSEPLERYAERLRAASMDGAAGIVLEYGALRYGGVGDAESVARRIEAFVADLAAPADAQ